MQDWPFSMAKAGIEENRTIIERNWQKRTKIKCEPCLFQVVSISSFNQSEIADTFHKQHYFYQLVTSISLLKTIQPSTNVWHCVVTAFFLSLITRSTFINKQCQHQHQNNRSSINLFVNNLCTFDCDHLLKLLAKLVHPSKCNLTSEHAIM